MKVYLSKRHRYFRERDNITLLNRLLRLHAFSNRISPHLLVSGTGCNYQEALQILILLYESRLADGYFLIYLKKSPDTYIGRRSFDEGFPKFPYSYEYNERTVESADEVLYQLEFKIVDSIEFVSHHE